MATFQLKNPSNPGNPTSYSLGSELDDAKKLYTFVRQKIETPKNYYILLDEIQEVKDWKKRSIHF